MGIQEAVTEPPITRALLAGDAGSIPVNPPQNFPSLDSMAGICNLAYIEDRKKLCHSFSKAVYLLLAICMLLQEVADILFHLEI